MRLLIVCGSVSLLVLACTVEHTELSQGDATKAYVAPAICEAQHRCVGDAAFVKLYPATPGDRGGSEAACEKKIFDAVPDKDAVTKCTNEDWKTCVNDFQNAPCPDPASGNTLPASPASCTKC